MPNKYALTYFNYLIGYTEKLLILICLISLVIIYLTDLDFIISDYIYETTQWKYKQSFWAETLMHKSTKIILITIYIGLAFRLSNLIKSKSENQKIYDLFIFLVTIIVCVSLVSASKRLFNVDCPWHLIRYGGDKPFYSLFNYPNNLLPSAHCFPASHASVGFSWIALYFYFKVQNLNYKNIVLTGVLIIGFTFGIAQQIRGAHFISHDIWSLIICLTTSILIYSRAYKGMKSNDKI